MLAAGIAEERVGEDGLWRYSLTRLARKDHTTHPRAHAG
jgi:hypothetical protein